MKRVAKVASPAAIAVLRQATALYPKRKKISDGLLPSPAHLKASPSSDHNTGLAVDLTHDPKNGIDCAVIFEKLKEDERVSYLIFNKKIWSRKLC
jgi:LAS superfamily LD-carboxypeptidase LdcB